MKRVFLFLLVFLVACSPLTGLFGSKDNFQPVTVYRSELSRLPSIGIEDATVLDLVRGNQEFAFNLYRAAVEKDPGNLIFSPYSVSLAFSMAYAGARGKSQAQMSEVMGFLPQAAHHPAFNALDQHMNAFRIDLFHNELEDDTPQEMYTGSPFRFMVANSVWGQQGYPFEADFLDKLARNYGAGLQAVDFGSDPEAAQQAINDWIEEHTQGRIKDIAPEFDPETRLALANAIYFKGNWLYPFTVSVTKDAPFTLLDGRQVSVPMMRRTEGSMSVLYLEGDGFRVALVPFTGNAIDMLVVLPDAGELAGIEARLNAEFLSSIRRDAAHRDVDLVMPRLDFASRLDLRELLEGMGLSDLFNGSTADFSGIATHERLWIEKAIHFANLRVDEEGAEAAAATLIELPGRGKPPEPLEMRLDRPFIFAIFERGAGSILFLGRVMNPSN
jgi:serpin B